MFYHLKIVHTKQDTGYFLPKVELKDYNDMIDGRNFFDKPVKKWSENMISFKKNTICQGDDYTTGFLQDYPYSKENYYNVSIYNRFK